METLLVLVLAFFAALSGCEFPLQWAESGLVARAADAEPGVGCETFIGEVAEGQGYQRPFAEGLLFRLRPSAQSPPNPAGWTIEVRESADGPHDFVWVATPPYRFSNPRDLRLSYGASAREVVAWDVRSFGFVTGEEQYQALAEIVGFLLWRPTEMSEARYEAVVDSVRTRWERMLERVGRGRLRITDADLADPDPDHPGGRIERIAFSVTLCATAPERLPAPGR